MKYQSSFKRYELKYIITSEQMHKILEQCNTNIVKDSYYHSTICNIYFDTCNNRLIRKSIEKPVYKEKMRIRSYGIPSEDSNVFLEIKKKYQGIVYKRRSVLKYQDYRNNTISCDTQINKEISYMFSFYNDLYPKMFLSYERLSYMGADNTNLRITFDNNIIYRTFDLELDKGIYGNKLLDDNTYIMEIKCNSAFPLWLVKILSKEKIYKTSFSKYGMAYKEMNLNGGVQNGKYI